MKPQMRQLVTVAALLLGGLAGPAGAPLAAQPAPALQAAPDAPQEAWPRPRDEAYSASRATMVEELQRYHRPEVEDPRVLAAMKAVPRHWFVPGSERRMAYADTPLPIGHGQTISQPYIVALMTELAAVSDTSRVLEIGTGSGYQAAVLNELTPHVFTMEIVAPLAEEVDRRFRERGYAAIARREGDGYFGWPEAAPFDAIVVTAAADHIPPPLVEQLAPGGRMVIPVGSRWGAQRLLLVTRGPDGAVGTRTILGVRFVPLTGGPDEP